MSDCQVPKDGLLVEQDSETQVCPMITKYGDCTIIMTCCVSIKKVLISIVMLSVFKSKTFVGKKAF